MTPREVLAKNFGKLSAEAQPFAASLLAARNPTEKQQYWISKLADQVTAGPKQPVATPTKINNVKGMVDWLTNSRLRFPKVAFRVGDRTLQLTVATERARYPGSLNVKDYLDGTWYGRVHKDGRWEVSLGMSEMGISDNIVTSLQTFAKDPAGVAAAYGLRTGNCCFCCKALTTDNSTEVGYGPICAENYHLPWGNKLNK